MTYEGYAVAVSSTEGVLYDLRGYTVAVSSTEGVLYDLRGYAVAMPAPQKVCCMTYEATQWLCQLHRRCVV